MTIFVYRNGRLVDKAKAPPIARGTAPNVISDYLPDGALRHPTTGKMMDSKSGFRAVTKAHGMTEIGNETQRDMRRFDTPDLKADIARTFSELGG